MSSNFWKSNIRKAKKYFKCTYCLKQIVPGMKYYRETGVLDNEFNDYPLCIRCKELLIPLVLRNSGEYELGNIRDDINNILQCKMCKLYSNLNAEFINSSYLNVKCNNCGYKSSYNLEDKKDLIKLFKE